MNYIIVMANRLDENIVSTQELVILSYHQSNEPNFPTVTYCVVAA